MQKSIDHILIKEPDALVVKKSGVEGKGLFARKPIQKGELILKIKGSIINHRYTSEFSKEGPNWIGIGYQKWIIPEPGDIAVYINHSCLPNVIISAEQDLLSLKNISAEEELFLDYSTTELDPFWRMKCNCGANNCRKIIKAFQFLPGSVKRKYRAILHPDFSMPVY